MNRILLVIGVLFWVIGHGGLHGPSGWCSEAGRIQAGAVAVNINPQSLPVQSNGSMTPRSADSVHDDLYARCLVIDNGSTKVALVVCDSCMIPRDIFDTAKQLAFEKTGIATDHILCSATHTHSGVSVAAVFQSDIETEYAAMLAQRIAEGIAQADAQREPARIGWALGNAPQHVFNRRWFMRPGVQNDDPFDRGTDSVRMNPPSNHRDLLRPAGPTDPQLPVLAVQALDGRPLAVWANYSLHYVGGVPGSALSADYFGEFARQFESLLGVGDAAASSGKPDVVVAMTNGTSGDINNVNFFAGTGLQQPFEQIRLVASELAKAALVAYQRIDFQDWIPLAVQEQEIELGVRKPTEAELTRAQELLAQSGDPPWQALRTIYAHETVQLAEYPDSVQLKLQVMRLGDLGIAAIPCETFVETGLALKAQSPLQPMFTIELANGYNGYLPTPRQHALGGYETWRAKSSYLAVDAEPQILQTLLRLLGEVARDKPPAAAQSQPDDSARIRQEPADALSMIESTRGGRHWVDLPTDPPKSPEESMACFQIEPGARIELVASEPLVKDPVWITFDDQGRMFVAEYGDYPNGPSQQNSPPLSRIVMLEDLDGDGVMDRRHLFAEQLNFCHSIMAFRNGILAGTKDAVLYLKDSYGDHQADVREVLFSGFQSPHPQMQIGCPQWGIDNWITMSFGPGKVKRAPDSLLNSLFGVGQGARQQQTSQQQTSQDSAIGQTVEATEPVVETLQLDIPNKDFRFHPLTFEFGPTSGFGQFGNTIDQWGRRFFCTNRNPLMAAPIGYEQLRRNPFWVATEDQYDVAPSGDQSVIYPVVQMKSNYLSHAGSYTAACGTTAYVGDLLGEPFRNSVFVCEPVGHVVTRYVVEPQGARLVARRARDKADFLTSTDTWFRPSSLANGPDGALYLADMTRLWVEHPRFLPPEVAEKMDWRAGEDRGRIWRIVPAGQAVRPKPSRFEDTPEALAAMLGHSNGWHRQLAQRLIVERQEVAVVPLLRQMIQSDSDATPTFAALATLQGLSCLTAQDVTLTLNSAHARVREIAARLAAEFMGEESVWLAVADLAQDSDAQVRLQAALTLGQTNNSRTTMALARIAAADHQQQWTGSAILTSSQGRSAEILVAMRAVWNQKDSASNSASVRLVRQLAECTSAEGNDSQLSILLGSMTEPNSQLDWWNLTVLCGLANGFHRYQGDMGRVTLQSFLSQPPAWFVKAAVGVRQLIRDLPDLAFDRSAPMAQRLTAIELLGHLPSLLPEGSVEQLLDSSQPGDIQLAALRTLKGQGVDIWSQQIIQRWPILGPRVRAEAISMLLADSTSALRALQSMLEGQMESAILTIDQRALLLAHPNSDIRQLAEKVIGSSVSADRESILQRYSAATTMLGDAQQGQVVFDRVCAACHRASGRGNIVGPDLSDSRNRSRQALLVDIIDPNHRIDPQYLAYQALTLDGQIFQGLLVAETSEALVLKLSGGHERTVLRGELEELKVGGKSLMPEGVENDVDLQQMADLLEFLSPNGSLSPKKSLSPNGSDPNGTKPG